MIEQLQTLDRWLLIAANHRHLHWLDAIMVFFSERLVWIPAYLALLVFLGVHFRRRAWLVIPSMGLMVGLADVISSRLFKPYFARLRPCHDPELSATLNLVNGCGGQFGFISSHAANTFALAVFLGLVLPRRYRALKIVLFLWAALVSYSRIYLGAHYPSDVLAGMLLGAGLAWMGAMLYQKLEQQYWPQQEEVLANR